jgi:hypothetical protein
MTVKIIKENGGNFLLIKYKIMEKQQYQIDYDQFLKDYKSNITTGENVGNVIAKMSQYYTSANLEYASALVSFNFKAKVIEERIDDNGKVISSSKAKILAAATEESQNLIFTEKHLDNIKTHIQSLKALQKGILNEQNFANL